MTFLNFKLYLYHKKKCLKKKVIENINNVKNDTNNKIWSTRNMRDDTNNVKDNKSMFGGMI